MGGSVDVVGGWVVRGRVVVVDDGVDGLDEAGSAVVGTGAVVAVVAVVSVSGAAEVGGRVSSVPSTVTAVELDVVPPWSLPGSHPARSATTTSAAAAHSHQNHRPSRTTRGRR